MRDKQIIKLVFGSTIQDKDLLRTGPVSNLQVRFVDESILSMRESSEIRIDEFRFAGKEDGTERAFFSLLKGGLRKITGIIGRTNNKNYQMGSVVATIGIRGTDYAATLCQGDCRNPDGALAKDGLYGRVIGTSFGTNRNSVTNETGEHLFGISQNYHVPDAKTVPQLLLEPPGFVSVAVKSKSTKPPAGTGGEQAAAGGAQEDPRGTTPPPPPPLELVFTGPEQRGPGGNPAVLPPANGFVVVYPLPPNAPEGDVVFDDQTLGTFNNLNQLTAYGIAGIFPAGSLNGGSITDTGSLTLSNGQVITWGRWTGNTRITLDDGSTFTGAPVLFGTASGLTNNSVIGSLGGVATYTYAGGPRPVDAGGNVGSITSTSATINFTAQTTFLSLGINFPSIVASGANTGSASFSVSGTGFRVFNAQFLGDFLGLLSGTCTGSGCFLGTGPASGFYSVGLTGSNGFEFAAFGGIIFETNAGDVAFLNAYQSSSFTPGPPPSGQISAEIAWAHPSFAPGSTFSVSTGPNATFDASGNLLAFTNPTPCTTGTCTLSGTLGTGSIVNPGSTALLDGGTMIWGRWNGGQITDRISGVITTYTPPTGVPFVGGTGNTIVPTGGSFTYTFAGGPPAVNTAGVVGSSLSQGAFLINFGATQSISVSTPLVFSVGGATVTLSTACGGACTFSGPAAIMNLPVSGSCVGSCSSIVSGNATGFLVGPQAKGLAVAGNVFAAPTITFAGAFKQ